MQEAQLREPSAGESSINSAEPHSGQAKRSSRSLFTLFSFSNQAQWPHGFNLRRNPICFLLPLAGGEVLKGKPYLILDGEVWGIGNGGNGGNGGGSLGRAVAEVD